MALFVKRRWFGQGERALFLAGVLTVLASLAPAELARESAGEAMARRKWLPSLFAAPAADERRQAEELLSEASLRLDGEAFVKAVQSGHRPLIALFRRAGIDLDAADRQGRTALLAAASTGDWLLFFDLLHAGANPNLAEAHGTTPLMAAAAANEVGALKALLEHGADLEAADEHGHRAVHYALAGQGVRALQWLLEQNARVEGTCCEGHDLLEHAFEMEEWAMITPVLEREPATLGWRPSSRALFLGLMAQMDAPHATLLLSKHPAAPTPEGLAQPLLAYAVLEDKLEQFKFLLQCGADPNTLLQSPVQKIFSDAVKSNFMRHYLEEEPGLTTLMLAAGLAKVEFVQALLEKGAKRGLGSDKYKMPAFSFAARTENPQVMQMLIGDCPKPEELRIEISLSAQKAQVIRNGVPSMTTRVSTGKPGLATPQGQFVITDKHLDHRSTIYKVPMPYFMRLNGRDFGMHEGNLPGYPASHGCIRLPGEMARRLYKEIPVGTLVTIEQ